MFMSRGKQNLSNTQKCQHRQFDPEEQSDQRIHRLPNKLSPCRLDLPEFSAGRVHYKMVMVHICLKYKETPVIS